MISKQVVVPNVFYALVVVRKLLSKNWQIAIPHIFCEANSAADFMANMAHPIPLGLHVFSSPSVSIDSIISQDMFEVTQPHFIHV